MLVNVVLTDLHSYHVIAYERIQGGKETQCVDTVPIILVELRDPIVATVCDIDVT
jgi:hypothetical protein